MATQSHEGKQRGRRCGRAALERAVDFARRHNEHIDLRLGPGRPQVRGARGPFGARAITVCRPRARPHWSVRAMRRSALARRRGALPAQRPPFQPGELPRRRSNLAAAVGSSLVPSASAATLAFWSLALRVRLVLLVVLVVRVRKADQVGRPACGRPVRMLGHKIARDAVR